MSIHFKPFTAISSQLRAIYSRIKRCPNISSHIQPFQANYRPFTDVLTNVQPFQAIYSHFHPFQAISRHFKPFPPILAHLFKGAGYSDEPCETKKELWGRGTSLDPIWPKIAPGHLCHRRLMVACCF